MVVYLYSITAILKKIMMNIVLADSTTVKVHRHGGGLKGGSKVRA